MKDLDQESMKRELIENLILEVTKIIMKYYKNFQNLHISYSDIAYMKVYYIK